MITRTDSSWWRRGVQDKTNPPTRENLTHSIEGGVFNYYIDDFPRFCAINPFGQQRIHFAVCVSILPRVAQFEREEITTELFYFRALDGAFLFTLSEQEPKGEHGNQ
jgi:hypothetical protein